MRLIQIRDGYGFSQMPCGSIAGAPNPAPNGIYRMLDFASGIYNKVDGAGQIAPPVRPVQEYAFSLPAANLRWVVDDAEGDKHYAQPWFAGGQVCSTHKGHRMRAARTNAGPEVPSVALPKSAGAYFTQSQGPLVISLSEGGVACILDPLTGRTLWFKRDAHPSAEKSIALLAGVYPKSEPWEPGETKLSGRNLYFAKALSRGVPKGTAYYNTTDPWAMVKHDAERQTVIAHYEREANHGKN